MPLFPPKPLPEQKDLLDGVICIKKCQHPLLASVTERGVLNMYS